MFNALKKFLRVLGPGIATYSQTGVQFGYGQLWTALFMLPLLAGISLFCSYILASHLIFKLSSKVAKSSMLHPGETVSLLMANRYVRAFQLPSSTANAIS